VSLWEIAIKVSIGKLEIPAPFEIFIPAQLKQNQIEVLPITILHLAKVTSLPFHHKDPFDRLIAIQSMDLEVPIVSSDKVFDSYGIERIW